MALITVCRKCQRRMVGELWHGPHCECKKPDFMTVDTGYSVMAQLQAGKCAELSLPQTPNPED